MLSVRPLRSTGIYPASSLVWASPTPFRPPRRLCIPAGRWSLSLPPCRAPRLLDRSFHARCPQPPRKARRALACCFPTGIRLHPSRQTGHLRLPNEAESGSLALRLACSPMPSLRQIDFSIPRLLGYMFEQAIYIELLSVHKISQAYPGTPTVRERSRRS